MLNGQYKTAKDYLDQAVEGLRKAGSMDDLPRGLLVRANYYTQTLQHPLAWRDLDECFEIASFGDMQLHLCDYHLAVCRDIASQLMNGQLKNENAPLLVIDNGQRVSLTKEDMQARLQQSYHTAAKMIDELPYHWRDDELAALAPIIDC